MDKPNYMLLVLVVAVTVAVTVGIIMHYTNKNCQPVVQVYPSCPNIPDNKYTDSPAGRCLLDCDQYSDQCYRQCDSRDENCIRNCYQLKAQCYMRCLGPQQESFTSGNNDCGCA